MKNPSVISTIWLWLILLDCQKPTLVSDNNPLREATELDREIAQPQVVTTDTCSVSDAEKASGLVVKGKGGVPPKPTEPFDDFPIIDDVGANGHSPLQENTKIDESSQQTENTNNFDPGYIPPHIKPVTHDENGEPIYAARGIIVRPDGGVTLTAYPTPGTPGYREYMEQMGCDVN